MSLLCIAEIHLNGSEQQFGSGKVELECTWIIVCICAFESHRRKNEVQKEIKGERQDRNREEMLMREKRAITSSSDCIDEG